MAFLHAIKRQVRRHNLIAAMHVRSVEEKAMVLSTYEKQRILFYNSKGLQILSALKVEGIFTTRQTVARFLLRYRKEGSGRPSKVSDYVLKLVERRMGEDDETTATQLHAVLTACGVSISLSTILRSRAMLGWTFRGSKYCQQIRHQKRFIWVADNYLEMLENRFEDVIWTDETTVQLESHSRHSYRKIGEAATLKPRPKHPLKLHVWAGISRRGATPIVIFSGIMDADLYINILLFLSFVTPTPIHID